jgi:phosphoglucan,water dikinase
VALRIRLGNQTSFSAPPLVPFRFACEHGFGAFEWFPDKKESGEGWEEDDLDEETRGWIRREASRRKMALSVHVPWPASPLGAEGDERMRKAMGLARSLGAGLVVVHFSGERGVSYYREAITPVLDEAARSGLRVAIENTVETGPDEINRLFGLLRGDKNSGAVGLCLDVGHANLYPATRNDYLRFVDALDERVPIIHVHLHENYGDADSHLPVFSGPAGADPKGLEGLFKRLRARGFDGAVIFEQWPEPPELLLQARERLLDMIKTLPKEKKPVRRERTGWARAARPPEDAAEAIARADGENRSWREKLEWVRDFLSKEPRPSLDELIYAAIYLRFLGTGQVRAEESGGHYRPVHHARAARDIDRCLSEVAGEEEALVARKILPWLPSYDRAFMRAEPLTRIRDIAHRGDIPKELKREIKTALQNKLHRSAGPEDLRTSERILKRIAAPGAGYSRDFVREFQIFHEELKEFFSATSLEERLRALLEKGTESASHIKRFLRARKQRERGLEGNVKLLGLLTDLRGRLLEEARRKDQRLQLLRLSEIALEDHAFVLQSEMVNQLDSLSLDNFPWRRALDALVLGVSNVGLSGISPRECEAVQNELQSLSRGFTAGDRDHLLRLKASLERARRLADEYTGRVLALFPGRVERLGRLLGVDEHAIRTFTEGDIRGNVVFQLSRLSSTLLKNVRFMGRLPLWDVLVPGRARGRLVVLKEMAQAEGQEPGALIAVLERAEGDEEIPARLSGLVLGHELPHLSHLGVRARQKGVVFAACGDRAAFAALKSRSGETVMLEASPEDVTIEPSTGGEAEPRMHGPVSVPGVVLSVESPVIPLQEVAPETGGAKAFNAHRLLELAGKDGAPFRALKGAVLPFAVMEEAIAVAGKGARYGKLTRAVPGMSPEERGRALEELRHILEGLELPAGIIERATGLLPGTDRFMVRSSASTEDLENFAAAGLHDSVGNVPREGLPAAIRQVWASLWTGRAVLARKDARIPSDRVHMAVFIQPMLVPDLSFIINTVNPISGKASEMYVELVPGPGETLASARVEGSPYRMLCLRRSGEVRMLSFADMSRALFAAEGGPGRGVVDYSGVPLTTDGAYRSALGRRLLRGALLMERAFGRPQDIEGAVVGDDVYFLQSRAQQGIGGLGR